MMLLVGTSWLRQNSLILFYLIFVCTHVVPSLSFSFPLSKLHFLGSFHGGNGGKLPPTSLLSVNALVKSDTLSEFSGSATPVFRLFNESSFDLHNADATRLKQQSEEIPATTDSVPEEVHEKEKTKDNIEEEVEIEEVYSSKEEKKEDNNHIIPLSELNKALNNAKKFLSFQSTDFNNHGWKVAYECQFFKLYKRKKPSNEEEGSLAAGTFPLPSPKTAEPKKSSFFSRMKESNEDSDSTSPIEYLMTGCFDDLSPQAFFKVQYHSIYRKIWDATTKEMTQSVIDIVKEKDTDPLLTASDLASPSSVGASVVDDCEKFVKSLNEFIQSKSKSTDGEERLRNKYAGKLIKTEDIVYSRVKWPWPLKDRDYLLARRLVRALLH
jgi:hypothetical protein